MKKNLIFTIILFLVAILLYLLKLTKLPVHIIVSVVGLAVLIAYTVMTKKEWKIPVLEIAMRVSYGLALITGVIVMNVHSVPFLGIVHKVLAILFTVLLIVLFVLKVVANKKNK